MDSVIDRQTDVQTDGRTDTMMPIADHTVYPYDWLKTLFREGTKSPGYEKDVRNVGRTVNQLLRPGLFPSRMTLLELFNS